MPFAPIPLVPGDAFDAALRFGRAVDADASRLSDPAERADRLARHWREAMRLGWAGILVPEESGGAGGALPDLVALVDGVGRSAAPLPLVSACAVAPRLLLAAGEAGRPALAEIADGQMRPCPIVLCGPSPPAYDDAPLRLREEGGRLVLHGTALGVEAPPEPTHHLVACDVEGGGAGPALVLLPADAPGLSIVRHERMDGRPTLDFECRSVPAGLPLAQGRAVLAAAEAAQDLGALLTCVESVSAMGALIEQTVAYLSGRVQFGAALSTFQALRHRAAEMYVAYENFRGLVVHAVRRMEEDPAAASRDVALAKLRLGFAGRFVAEAGIQLHGGMGLTEELAAGRLARRILMAEFEYGDRAHHAARLLDAA